MRSRWWRSPPARSSSSRRSRCRRRGADSEFALLRALGVTRRGLAALLALEGAVIGAVGARRRDGAGHSPAAARCSTHIGARPGRRILQRRQARSSHPISRRSPSSPSSASACRSPGRCGSRAPWDASRWPRRCAIAPSTFRGSTGGGGKLALALFARGLPLLLLPPIDELPLGGYAAIALWLARLGARVAPACRRLLLARLRREIARRVARARASARPSGPSRGERGRHRRERIALRGDGDHGVLVSRLPRRLAGGRGARGPLRAVGRQAAATATSRSRSSRRVARLAEVNRWSRSDSSASRRSRRRRRSHSWRAPSTKVSSPDSRPSLAGMPARGAEIPVWISEATRDLQRLEDRRSHRAADRGPRCRRFASPASIRDFARTWGAMHHSPRRLPPHHRRHARQRPRGLPRARGRPACTRKPRFAAPCPTRRRSPSRIRRACKRVLARDLRPDASPSPTRSRRSP